MSSRPVLVVVGAGVSGLAAARALRRSHPGADVVVLEAAGRIGGKLAVSEVAGVAVDEGAENMLARHPAGAALLAELGLVGEAPATTSAAIHSRGRARPLPTGTVLGVPSDLGALLATGLVDADELHGPPGQPLLADPAQDVSVGDVVTAGIGRAVVDRLVDPLLGGVYAGRADRLSLAATIPALHRALVGRSDLVGAAETVRASTAAATGPVFLTLAGGMGALPALMAEGIDVRTGTTVRALARLPGGRWRLETGPAPQPSYLEADAVILALPAAPAARLLAPHAAGAAARLAEVEYAGVALVTLALDRADAALPLGSGLLVPAEEGLSVKAVTYYSAKWAWAERAAPDLTLVRLSVGRHGESQVLQRSDDELATLARADLEALTGVRAVPVDTRVTRWGGALPQYAVGHLDLVAQVRRAVADLPGLAVCGAAYDGVGIPACVASGVQAASTVTLPAPAQARAPG